MPQFLHLPTNRLIDTDNHSQSVRYRRSSNFIELTGDEAPSTNPPHIDEDAPESTATTPHDPTTTPPLLQVPTGTVPEIIEWVGDNPRRARAALDAEQQGKNRVTLLRRLSQLLDH